MGEAIDALAEGQESVHFHSGGTWDPYASAGGGMSAVVPVFMVSVSHDEPLESHVECRCTLLHDCTFSYGTSAGLRSCLSRAG